MVKHISSVVYSPRRGHRALARSQGEKIEGLISPLPVRHAPPWRGQFRLVRGTIALRCASVSLRCACEPDCQPSPRFSTPSLVLFTLTVEGICSYTFSGARVPATRRYSLLAARVGS